MLLGVLGVSLLGNLLASKETIIVGEGTIRAGQGTVRAGQDFERRLKQEEPKFNGVCE